MWGAGEPSPTFHNRATAESAVLHPLNRRVVHRVGLLLFGQLVMTQRIRELAGGFIDACNVVVSTGTHGRGIGTGRQGDSLAVGPDRLRGITGFLIRQAQVAVSLAEPVIQLDGLAEKVDGLVQLPAW